MKRLSNYINESIFDDHVHSNLKIHGLEVNEDDYAKCQKYFDEIYKKLKGKKTYTSPSGFESVISYFGKDCIVFTDTSVSYDSWMYIVCPEAIYMQYVAAKECELTISIDALEKFKVFTYGLDGDYLNLAFVARISKYNKEWYPLEGPSMNRGYSLRELQEKNIPIRAYIPETISQKAKNVIKKYM